ncbi:MAG: MlaC/ttg2D family ABC transporter substrate-binding protein, partial [Acetobacteraceae bacterium]
MMVSPAVAQTPEQAAVFIKDTGSALVHVVNSGGSTDKRSAALAQIIAERVDVDGIAKFCLGRFWRVATAAQQEQYLDLFHRVLVLSIDAKMGEYKGVTFTIGRTVPGQGGQVVSTVINRPSQQPANVDWVVEDVNGS